MISEAKAIKKMELWARLITTVKGKAHQRMFEKSQSWEDMYFGKAALYTIDIIDKRITALSKLNNSD